MVMACEPDDVLVKRSVPCAELVRVPTEIPPAKIWKLWFGGKSLTR
jgi:hypothetical protein